MDYDRQNKKSNYYPFSDLFLITKVIISLGFLLFAFSLLFTSFFTSGEDIQGIWVLIIGWAGLIVFQFSWFANPLNLLAFLILSQRPVTALLLSVVGFILASQSFLFSEIPINFNHDKIYVKEFGLGFYLWYLSQGLFFVGIFVEFFERHKKTETRSVFNNI